MSAPLLAVSDLVVSYPLGSALGFGRGRTFDAVKGVSFTIEPGQGFALVGESGSGKSTIGRAILGLVPVASGSIVFDGADVAAFGKRVPLAYRRQVQVVFQDPRSSLNPRRTVGEQIGQVLQRHFSTGRTETERRVCDLLGKVGLGAYFVDRFPGELSGGQRQRVAIARALATEPRLLICDEPVSALDVSTQSQVLNLLASLRIELGLAYLFISHDLAVVRQVADVVAVMQRGRIVEVGTSDTLYEAPADPYTRLLLSSVPQPSPLGREERRAARRALRAAPA
ncbi:ATP-binding cassette domain-containing protein [Faunimonas sp. B44]|uniref:ATP-binding cassette domain-containing protein n=1 Tax=Faunimonas sp. B44 TaxID=3461493 RepID=UPI004043C6B3